MFFSALTSSAFAGYTVASTPVIAPGKFYAGIFGGRSYSNQFNATQLGTAFYPEASGGPLAVNAFGNLNNQSSWLWGGQVGYQVQEILLNPTWYWLLAPAIEFEGYAFGNRTFSGDLTNATARLPEHDFIVTYPMNRSVFLANFVLNLDNHCYRFHPYVGVGLGGAIIKISGADSTQIAPAEPGINHYNANNSDTSPTFAGQIKAGVSYDINTYVSLFAEYRWLYLSSTHFIFGSTVYPAHPETANWQVKLNSQHYNIGALGVRFNLS